MFSNLRRRALAIGVSATLAGGLLAAVATPVAADYGSGAVYQIGLSFNCMNKTLCVASGQNPFGIGGFWGWIELDANHSGEGELLGQGHSNANPLLNGTVKLSIDDFSWWTSGGLLFVSSPELGVFVLPAASGNYRFSFGPGTESVVQISLVG